MLACHPGIPHSTLSVEFGKTSDFESTVTNLRPLQDVEVVDKGRFSALLIDAEKMVNDRNNPKAPGSRDLKYPPADDRICNRKL
jgi:hypothetical protein